MQCAQIKQHRTHVENAGEHHERNAAGIDAGECRLKIGDERQRQNADKGREQQQQRDVVCLKNRSTRYLSKCVEMAQSTGPENAKTSQDIVHLSKDR